MSKKLWITVETVEDGGLLVWDKVYPEKKFVFVSPRGFYEWLCQQMGTNAKPDSPTHDGRVVVDANKLERLERLWKWVQGDCDNSDLLGRITKYGPMLEILGREP